MQYREWENNWNPFNSAKVLYFSPQLKAMSEGETPVPICVTIDPTNACNMNCSFCIMKELRAKKQKSIPESVLLEMPAFLKSWGVESVCVGGGGEPFCHPAIGDLFRELGRVGMPTGTITNGLALDNDELTDIVIANCRWIGFSVDAAREGTHHKLKSPNKAYAFSEVLSNIRRVANRRRGSWPSIGMKFCIQEENYREIFDFVELAKKIGADDVHFRPVYIPDYVFPPEVAKHAQELIIRAREKFEDDSFHVYGIVHKFDGSWKRKIDFEKCLATPVNAYFMADGTLGLCCDRRDDKELNLGPYYPFGNVLEKWGSPEHKAMLASIEPQKCPRCTQCVTNEIIEHVILKDEMCVRFV